jgi:di/tricarboxylate transporter
MDFDEEAEAADVIVLGLIRGGRRYGRSARSLAVAAEDLLIVRGSAEAIAAFIRATGLHEASDVSAASEAAKPAKRTDEKDAAKEPSPEVVEAVVRADSVLVGRTAASFGLRRRFGVTMLGIARSGAVSRQGVHERSIEAGDVLLLTGRGAASSATLDQFGLIAVDRVSTAPFKAQDAAIVIGFFIAAVAVATMGWLSFTVAIAVAVAAYAAFGIVPARDFYANIEWPVVVMLACLLPIGAAFDSVGATSLVVGGIVEFTQNGAPVVALVAIMVATMMLSDVLNNVATMVITGPIAIDLAHRLGVNPDTFLMGVAISASCAFLTPIGHKNNTLIMGPGGFRFSDYWRMGLPLEIVVLLVGVPTLLAVWPL